MNDEHLYIYFYNLKWHLFKAYAKVFFTHFDIMGVRKKKRNKDVVRIDNRKTLNINYSMSVTSEFEFKINSTSMSYD